VAAYTALDPRCSRSAHARRKVSQTRASRPDNISHLQSLGGDNGKRAPLDRTTLGGGYWPNGHIYVAVWTTARRPNRSLAAQDVTWRVGNFVGTSRTTAVPRRAPNGRGATATHRVVEGHAIASKPEPPVTGPVCQSAPVELAVLATSPSARRRHTGSTTDRRCRPAALGRR